MGILGRTLAELRLYVFSPREAVERDSLSYRTPGEAVASLVTLIAFAVLSVTVIDFLVQLLFDVRIYNPRFGEPSVRIEGGNWSPLPVDVYILTLLMTVTVTVGFTVAAAVLSRELHPFRTLYSGIYAGAGFLLLHFSLPRTFSFIGNYGYVRRQAVVLLTGGRAVPPAPGGTILTTADQRFADLLYAASGPPYSNQTGLLQAVLVTVLLLYFFYIFYLEATLNYDLGPVEAVVCVWVGALAFVYEGLLLIIPPEAIDALRILLGVPLG